MVTLFQIKFRIVKQTTLFSVLLFFFSCSSDNDPAALSINAYEPEFAMAGAQIIIKGTSFGTSMDDVQAIFFDGEEAVVTALTNTSITVTVPNNAYQGTVKVRVKDKEVEGPVFSVMTVCNSEVGLLPCPRVKPG